MEHVHVKFEKETNKSQPLLSHSSNPEKLEQLRKKHNFPSDGRGAQLQQSTVRHYRAQSDTTEYIRTRQNIARHNRSYLDETENIRIQQSIFERKGKNLLEEIAISEKDNEQLKLLEAKYLLCGEDSPPISRQDSQVEYIVDGVDYFRRVHELIQSTRKGDTIFISGLSLDPHFDLLNRPRGDPDRQELGDLLAEKAADGIDVRILVASGLVTSSLPVPKRFLFRRNTLPAIDLRTRIPKTRSVPSPPLAGRVALDWSGALLGTSHQKLVLVSHQGNLTALVTGLDFLQSRYDQYPHNTLCLEKKRWGWHDASVLVTGPITESIWENFRLRWQEVSTLPKRPVRMKGLKFGPINPPLIEETPKAPQQMSIPNPGVSLQNLRSFGKWKVDSLLPFCRKPWSSLPREGIKEIYQCLTKALGNASQYIYIEDQYLEENPGGEPAFEIYPFLAEAAKRYVKVILLGSGIPGSNRPEPDREENTSTLPAGKETSHMGMSTLTNQPSVDHDRMLKVSDRVSRDIQKKVLDRLTSEEQSNIVVYHVEHLTTHSKVTLVDDEFASVGSANIFSRSMIGVDQELNVALVTTGTQVRDLRVKLWAEHLRSPLSQDLINALHDQELAFGIWRKEWLPETADRQTWREAGHPKGFEPREHVLKLVGPELGKRRRNRLVAK